MPARRISTFAKVAVAILGITALFGMAFAIQLMFDDDDERPPIIVRNGSLLFETAMDWVKDTSGTHRYKPDHAKGGSVRTYSVKVVGSSTAACTGATLTGLEIFVDYLADSTATAKQFHLYRKRRSPMSGSMKRDPTLDSPEPMTAVPATTSAPAQLVYPVGTEGWISNVTVGGVSCAFTKPPDTATRNAVRVEIKPTI